MSHTSANIDAEQALLACCILDGGVTVLKCTEAGISPQSFTTNANSIVFATLAELASRRVPIDASAVAAELQARGTLPDVGGYTGIAAITNQVPTTAQATYYAGLVLMHQRKERVRADLQAAIESISAPASQWSDVWEKVEPHLRAAQEVAASSRARTLREIATNAAEWREKPEARPTISTPWRGWDYHATPPRAGELIVIAGRPGTGKSTFAGNIAHDAATIGSCVAYFSLEMSGEELVERFAIRRVGRAALGRDRASNAAVVSRIRSIGEEPNLRIFDGDAANALHKIESQCRLIASSSSGLGAVFIDYLQLVTPPADTVRSIREQQVSAMTRRFKQLAQSLNCPVFLLSQLNRAMERENRAPCLSDLRESGAIEQDADRVWFLYEDRSRPDEAPTSEPLPEITITAFQAKCRNGPAGMHMDFLFHRPTFTFSLPLG